LHDPQRLAAGFMDALQVLPPEVQRHQGGEKRGKVVYVERERLPEHLRDFV
jgi:hypothetical protein